ncbi:DDB1- and CUL4-associated factor 13 [Orchesella cincta]|uniref:DDB1-and CUL4-associated factor 13 n=1 Tax=Orchesella cincta TaxID=48709 RepID=A0A1D2MYQ8_ORCCI|nr:DDB1- and CUL4-associated factor 13 [Orchesella cincta]
MKVKVLSRNPDRYFRETKNDIHKVPRNYDPALHPFEMQREYVRALNATKLERVFAKPFLGCFDGHSDVVSCLNKHPDQLSWLYSGAADGMVKQWNIPLRKCVRTMQAHEGYVRGMTFTEDSETLITIGDDKNIRFWSSKPPESSSEEDGDVLPKHSIITKYQLSSISHHAKKNLFATCGDACLLWEGERNEPINKFEWGADTMNCVRFNPSQCNVLGGCASDRSILLYDIRGGSPIRKVVLSLRSNSICWNPMEPFVFVAANEDYNSYMFDMRRLKNPLNVFKDHVSAVIDVDFSPTGKEIVTGSYDKTIRIFEVDKGHSREVYHTKRMQRLTSVLYTMDNKYIISGSDEMNIRIWKAKAWEKLGTLKTRERNALNYNESLKEKFAHFPQIKRIARHRHVPRHVYHAKKELQTIRDSKKRKEDNRRQHTKRGVVPHVPERQKNVVSEQE